MKNAKTDSRSKYTQMIIKQGLLKLSLNKPLNKITIKELCDVAGTNRITFYNHFYDIYDVYETIEKDFYNELTERLGAIKALAAETSLIKEIVLQLYRNADICNLLVNTNSTVISKAMKLAQEQYVAELSSTYKQIPLTILNPLFIFLIHGYVGLIIDWIKNGMRQTPEDIGDLIIDFHKYSLDGIAKNLALQ